MVARPTPRALLGLARLFAASVFGVWASLSLGCSENGPSLIPLQRERTPGWQCNVPFTELLHHDFGGFLQEEFRVIDNPDDWCAVWGQMSSAPDTPCDTTLVDFSTEVAILAADPGAVWLTITCVQGDDLSARARVLVEESVLDPPNCIVFIRKPYPVHVVKVDRVALVATFVRERANLCPAQP